MQSCEHSDESSGSIKGTCWLVSSVQIQTALWVRVALLLLLFRTVSNEQLRKVGYYR
jgi:hypothetical protein